MAFHLVHPHIVRTFEHGTTNRGEHFLVMEFIDGVSFQFVRETRSARTAEKLEFLAQGAEGLAALHAAGFIHHDINPRNFLVTRDQQVKLIDFGLSVPNRPAFCGPGNRTGTIQYMAPELLRREAIDERIDIFAFGVMAFELSDRAAAVRRDEQRGHHASAHQCRAARPRNRQTAAFRGTLRYSPPVDSRSARAAMEPK